ncbi:12095_t:CDS:2, partial [Funneliformis caledonium]
TTNRAIRSVSTTSSAIRKDLTAGILAVFEGILGRAGVPRIQEGIMKWPQLPSYSPQSTRDSAKLANEASRATCLLCLSLEHPRMIPATPISGVSSNTSKSLDPSLYGGNWTTMTPIIRSQEEATKQVILIGEKGTKGGCQSAATLKTSLNY